MRPGEYLMADFLWFGKLENLGAEETLFSAARIDPLSGWARASAGLRPEPGPPAGLRSGGLWGMSEAEERHHAVPDPWSP
jgi:hypothetical protein